MENRQYTIRTMQPHEVNMAVEWAAAEGWNPGLHDAECYRVADPNGFLVGLLDDEPIAVISVIKYSAAFGFLGFYLVKPAYRGKGYGIQIWNAGLEYLKGANIGLDGVVEQQDNYKQSGFKLAYRNIRYEGLGGGVDPDNSGIVALSTLPFEAVESYDRPFLPANRAQFIQAWISQSDCHALGVMQDGKLAGYGVIRQCRSGYKIAPLYADTPALAEQLFLALKSRVSPSDLIYLDTPEQNQAAVSLAERHNMTVSFETARMYTQAIPALPVERLFGVASFEIG
ncbi:MAG: GNAT family N-acetyltransferase [Oceanospirillaceae bacterium]|nr:GNAT family N-acetyltransferase [Oceanospirillaceae bacterium]